MKDDVVADGKVVTAVGPQAARKFGEKLIEVMTGK
jgi:putative intracellular protease/amidase